MSEEKNKNFAKKINEHFEEYEFEECFPELYQELKELINMIANDNDVVLNAVEILYLLMNNRKIDGEDRETPFILTLDFLNTEVGK